MWNIVDTHHSKRFRQQRNHTSRLSTHLSILRIIKLDIDSIFKYALLYAKVHLLPPARLWFEPWEVRGPLGSWGFYLRVVKMWTCDVTQMR